MNILILCTGNTCRSQMAATFLNDFASNHSISSAGTEPGEQVNPYAIRVMQELGYDLRFNTPKHVENFIADSFDYVITVCDNANETCPVFVGEVKKRIHAGFEDPTEAGGSEEEILEKFRKVRDEIKDYFFAFYSQNLAE